MPRRGIYQYPYQEFTKTLLVFTDFHFSHLPIQNVLEVFVAGDMARGGGETEVADLPGRFGAKPGREAKEPGGGDVGQVAFGEFCLDAVQVAADLLPALLATGEALLGQRLGLDRPKVLDSKLVLLAPLDESRFRDFKLSGDSVIGPALSPELDEPRDSFLIFHNWSFCSGQRPEGTLHKIVNDAHGRVRHPPFLTEKGPERPRANSHPTGMFLAGQSDAAPPR